MERNVKKTCLDELDSINRNQNGDYYFIFRVPKVRNSINPKAHPRNEVLIVGVPKKQLVNYLRSLLEAEK